MAPHHQAPGQPPGGPHRPAPGPDTSRLSDMERAGWTDRMTLEDASRIATGLARYEPGVVSQLPGESILRIEVNGELAGAVHCLDDAPAELALGWAFMHGFLDASGKIDAVTVDEDRVSLMIATPVDISRRRRIAAGWIEDPDPPQARRGTGEEPFAIHADVLLDVAREAFAAMTTDRARDGFVHAAAASDTGVHCVARDMSAGPAVAKIAGWVLRDGRDADVTIVALRGIVDRGIISALARLGVRIVVTTGIPTADAFREATGLGVSIVGMAGSQRPGLLVDAGHIVE